MSDVPPGSNPSEPRRRRRVARANSDSVMASSGKTIKQFGLGLVVVAVLGFGARPAYRLAKEWWAVRAAHRVDDLVRAGKLNEATKPIQTALHLAPNRPEVLRSVARACSVAKMPEAVGFWKMLAQATELTAEDRGLFATAALEQGQLTVAQEQLAMLSKLDPKNLDTRFQTLRLLELQGRVDDAIPIAASTLSLDPQNPKFQFTLAGLLSRSRVSTNHTAGKAMLWNLAFATNAYQGPAIDFLLEGDDLSRPQSLALAKALEKSSAGNVVGGLRLAELLIRANPDTLERVAEALAAPVRQQTNLVDTLLVASWMGSQGLASNVLSFCEGSLLRTNPALLRPRIEALASLKRYAEVEALLATREKDFGPVLSGAYTGLLKAIKGDPAAAETYLRGALQASQGNAESLRIVSRAAENARLLPIAILAEQQLLRQPGQALTSARNLSRLLGPNPDIHQAREVLGEITGQLPFEPAYLIELCYLRGILGDDLPWAQKALNDLGSTVGALPQTRVAMALIHARSDNAPAALALLESGGIDWDSAPPRWRAVYALALGKSQQSEGARRLATKIPAAELREVELALIAPWR